MGIVENENKTDMKQNQTVCLPGDDEKSSRMR